MLVLFGSQTGNAQDVAERIVWEARAAHKWDAFCLPMDAVSLAQLSSHQVVVYVCSTTGMSLPSLRLRNIYLENVWIRSLSMQFISFQGQTRKLMSQGPQSAIPDSESHDALSETVQYLLKGTVCRVTTDLEGC
jgi:sulfite reductase alpha subunit-like flavoprotein